MQYVLTIVNGECDDHTMIITYLCDSFDTAKEQLLCDFEGYEGEKGANYQLLEKDLLESNSCPYFCHLEQYTIKIERFDVN